MGGKQKRLILIFKVIESGGAINSCGFEMSINALLKKYFEHDILEKCQCGGLLDLKQLFISVPNTLALTINRFEIDMNRQSYRKNCTEIKADRTINLELCTDSLHNVQYQR